MAFVQSITDLALSTIARLGAKVVARIIIIRPLAVVEGIPWSSVAIIPATVDSDRIVWSSIHEEERRECQCDSHAKLKAKQTKMETRWGLGGVRILYLWHSRLSKQIGE